MYAESTKRGMQNQLGMNIEMAESYILLRFFSKYFFFQFHCIKSVRSLNLYSEISLHLLSRSPLNFHHEFLGKSLP